VQGEKCHAGFHSIYITVNNCHFVIEISEVKFCPFPSGGLYPSLSCPVMQQRGKE
jgi:hypothetical protein